MTSIEVFTDGSAIKRTVNNKKIILGGYGIYFPNKEIQNISRKFTHEPITNQRSELYAIYVALILINKSLDSKNVTIYTDSEYSINCLTKWSDGWIANDWKTATGKSVKNQDILKPLISILKKFNVTFKHVHSHTGKSDYLSVGNAIVDKLATSGALS